MLLFEDEDSPAENQIIDANVEELIHEFRSRVNHGYRKYGTTTNDNPLSLLEWIDHALKEAMDFCVYLNRIKRDLRDQPGGMPPLTEVFFKPPGRAMFRYVLMPPDYGQEKPGVSSSQSRMPAGVQGKKQRKVRGQGGGGVRGSHARRSRAGEKKPRG